VRVRCSGSGSSALIPTLSARLGFQVLVDEGRAPHFTCRACGATLRVRLFVPTALASLGRGGPFSRAGGAARRRWSQSLAQARLCEAGCVTRRD